MMAKLIINPTSAARREIPLARSLVSIGRDPSNDLVLPDAMVSRRHAVIEYRGAQYFIRDCNSSNGSLVNGDRVNERGLRDGDLVAIGTARLLFRDDYASEDPAGKVVQHPSAPRQNCPKCQAEYRKSDVFCRQCGSALVNPPQPKVVCTSCGTVVPLPAKFCNACGTGLVREGEALEVTKPRPALQVEDEPAAAPAPDAARAEGPPPGEERLPRLGTTSPGRGEGGRPAGGAPAAAMDTGARPAPRPLPARPQLVRDERARPAPGPASFGARATAGLVDALLLGTVEVVLFSPALLYWWSRPLPATVTDVAFLPILLTLSLVPLGLVLGAVYHVYFWAVKAATPGMGLFSLVLEADDGTRPIETSQAMLRLLGMLLSGALLGIGFLMIALSGEALHDRIAQTRVVRKES